MITDKLRLPRVLALSLVTVNLLTYSAIAEEGGAAHYLPGGAATMSDLAPDKPGWVIEAMYLHYNADMSKNKELPVSNLITAGLNATVDSVVLGGIYTFENEVLGAQYSLGTFLPYSRLDVSATIEGNGVSAFKHDRVDGVGDITLIPAMMSWKLNDCWKANALLSVYAPTGSYEKGRLANTGLNHWTFDPTIGAAYSNAQTGFNFTAFSGVAFSTENNTTNYQNGTAIHLDASVQQLLPLGSGFLGLGVEGFYFQQVTGDSGSGAKLGDFKGMTSGLGPVITYLLPGENTNFIAEFRWLKELDVNNRLKGDYFWLKLIYQF